MCTIARHTYIVGFCHMDCKYTEFKKIKSSMANLNLAGFIDHSLSGITIFKYTKWFICRPLHHIYSSPNRMKLNRTQKKRIIIEKKNGCCFCFISYMCNLFDEIIKCIFAQKYKFNKKNQFKTHCKIAITIFLIFSSK